MTFFTLLKPKELKRLTPDELAEYVRWLEGYKAMNRRSIQEKAQKLQTLQGRADERAQAIHKETDSAEIRKIKDFLQDTK